MPTTSRLAVARALHQIFGQGERLHDPWDEALGGGDARLAQALLGLCLRKWGRIQTWSDTRLKDPQRGLPLPTRIALALGISQLAWLEGIAEHAAVDEAVRLVGHHQLGFPPHRGLTNALLRKAARDRLALRTELEAMPSTLDRSPFSERVLQEALASWGEPDGIETLWERLQIPSKACYRVVQEPLPVGMEPDPSLPGAWILSEGEAFPMAWLQAGGGLVQDRSSQALLQFRIETPVEHILDLCASPGGKTAGLHARFPKARLEAVEWSPPRARRLRENLERWRIPAQVHVAEAGEFLCQSKQTYDLIFLDAPCSGSGTLQKHPELNWIGGGIDLEGLRIQQRRLIQASTSSLRPGGLLIYAVCSWLHDEGIGHASWVQDHVPDLQPVQVWDPTFCPPGAQHFAPHPIRWNGEGFQGLAWTRA